MRHSCSSCSTSPTSCASSATAACATWSRHAPTCARARSPATAATLALARDAFALRKVLAIVSPDNARSIALLRRLGLRDAGSVRLPGKDEDILLFETAEDWRCATTSS